MDIPKIASTPVSERLYHQALAWFRLHPGHTSFLRAYVPGEFQEQQEKEFVRDLGGEPLHAVQVTIMHFPMCARMPLTEEMYRSVASKHPFFSPLGKEDRPLLQEWLLPFREKLPCDRCRHLPASWEIRLFEDIGFVQKLFAAKIKKEFIDDISLQHTLLQQTTEKPHLYETTYVCQRCAIQLINAIMGNQKATQVIPILKTYAERGIHAVLYRYKNAPDKPYMAAIKGNHTVESIMRILAQPLDPAKAL